MKTSLKYLVLTLLVCVVVSTSFAQDNASCPLLVQSALDSAQENCTTIAGNQVCYGNTLVDADIQNDSIATAFELPGDIVEISNLRRLRLSALDTELESWGIVLIEVSSDPLIPIEDENLTYVFFGDVSVDNVAARLPIEISQDTVAYAEPNSASLSLARLKSGDTLAAISRSEDAEWLEIELNDGQLAWISSDLITSNEAIVDLAIYNEESSGFASMQAFYFETGINDAACEQAPESGILLQTPEGIASVTVWVDGIYVDIDGTAYLQADAEEGMTVNVLEGDVVVEGLGVSQNITAGMQLNVELDESLNPLSPPTEPEPYNPDDFANLPLDLLARPIEIADPFIKLLPNEGQWLFSWAENRQQCPDGTIINLDVLANQQTLQIDSLTGNLLVLGVTLFPSSGNSYSAIYTDLAGTVYQYTLTVLSATSISGTAHIDLAACVLDVPFSLSFQN